MMYKKLFLLSLTILAFAGFSRADQPTSPPTITLPRDQRPQWLIDEGIVMAGDWVPLIYKTGGLRNGKFAPTEKERALHEAEHSPETLDKLQTMGVNFIMTHGYMAFGIKNEKQDMELTKRYTQLCHERGLHVGVYIFSGTLVPECVREEAPDYVNWQLRDKDGKPMPYPDKNGRVYMNRMHPGLQRYVNTVIDYALNEMKVDLLHFDNFNFGSSYDPYSVKRFREYLKQHGTPAEFNLPDFETAQAPQGKSSPALRRAWLDFGSQSQADAYYYVASHARAINPKILIELNDSLYARTNGVADFGRLLSSGEAAWNEHWPKDAPGYRDGRRKDDIREYKTAQAMDNMVFLYIRTPVDAAQSLAYNTDCFGCIAWYSQNKIVNWGGPPNGPISQEVLNYVKFFHEQRPYYKLANRVADVGVLRSYASQLFAAGSAYAQSEKIENLCIDSRIPWMVVYDQLNDLDRFPCLSVAGADALSDQQVKQIADYVRKGGALIYSERSGIYDEKMRKRDRNPLVSLSGGKTIKVGMDLTPAQFADVVAQACGHAPSLTVSGPEYLTTELCQQDTQRRRLVHLVNYKADSPVQDTQVKVGLPDGWKVKKVVVIRPETPKGEPVKWQQKGRYASFTVPQVDVYGLVSVECGK